MSYGRHFFIVISILLVGVLFAVGELEELYRWKQIRYSTNCASKDRPAFIFVDPEQGGATPSNEAYAPQNNLPMGVSHHNGRLFITMPRRRPGVPSTLNVINMAEQVDNQSPLLTAYPDCETNILKFQGQRKNQSIVSVYRTRVDACDRLWFIDTGLLEYPNNNHQVQRPSIWIIDLKTNQKIRRFEIPDSVGAAPAGLASITIDVDAGQCDSAYAYIPDLASRRLHVYSLQENRMWSFRHNYFAFDPLSGDFNVAGLRYQWDDGIFSIVLTPREPNGFRYAYFHPMASTSEFAVSTMVLRNESTVTLPSHQQGFMFIGNRGTGKQSAMHDYDPITETMFYSEVGRNGVGCWNTKTAFSAANHGSLAQNDETMIYPGDLQVDSTGTLWVMTNRLPIFVYSTLNLEDFNFRLWKQTTRNAIAGTICQ